MTRKEKATDRLLKAVGNWVTANGGSAVVAGGIGLIHDGQFRYKVVVGVTGKPPTKEDAHGQ